MKQMPLPSMAKSGACTTKRKNKVMTTKYGQGLYRKNTQKWYYVKQNKQVGER